jgi:hypothetical protein
MAERVLLTAGRTVIALDLARQLHAAGATVFWADSFARTMAAHSRAVAGSVQLPPPRFQFEAFVDALLNVIDQQRIDRLIPVGEEVLHVARALPRLRRACAVDCDELQRLDALHEKMSFQRLAATLGPAPPTWEVESEEQLEALLARHGPLVLKTVYGRFGRSFLRVDRPPIPPRRPGRWLAQPYIVGRELCTFSLAEAGRITAHVTYLPRFRLPHGPAFYFQPIEHPRARQWTETFVHRQSFTGPIGFDFIEAPDGTLYPLEANPRFTSGVHLFGAEGGLVPALLSRGSASPSPRPAMIAFMMLAVALPRVRRPRGLLEWARAFAAARDVIWRRRDPWPSLHFMASARELRQLRRQHGLDLRAATTHYSEWNGAHG